MSEISKFVFSVGLLVSIVGCVPKAALRHDDAQLELLMNEKQARVDSCYENAKASNPRLETGALTIQADHNPDGSLSSISLIRGFPGSQPLFECIKADLQTASTDRPLTRGPLVMTWNFK